MILKDFKVELEQRIKSCDTVFVAPHLGPDFDAIASAIGFALIAKKLEKPCYILLADNASKIDASVRSMIDEYKDKVDFINVEKFQQLNGEKDLLIATDVNKKYLVGCEKYLKDFEEIVVIDHHEKDENSIEADTEIILEGVSSVSEVIPELLSMFGVRYDKNVATYLLAGIYVDTDRLRKNTTHQTIKMVDKLLEKEADLNKVNELFEEDFYSDRKIQALVNKSDFFTYTIIMAIEDADTIYTKEELAKAADYLLKYKADAAIAAGMIDDDLISISARSKGKIDVSKIMAELGGGGNCVNAAAKIQGSNMKEVEKKLVKAIRPNFYKLEKED